MSGTYFVHRLSRPQDRGVTGRIINKIPKGPIGSQTHDLPACSVVPQPNELPRAPNKYMSTLCMTCNSNYCYSNSRYIGET